MIRGVKNGILLLFICFMLAPFCIKAEAADSTTVLTTKLFGDECIITGCNPQAEGVLDIPSEISGRKVTAIGENAFLQCEKLTEINLPDTIVEIGSNAFSICTKLSRVTLPDSIKIIGQGMFSQCVNLEEVILPDSFSYIPENTFNNCSSLSSIKLPEATKIISESAFCGCSSLTNIVFPEGLTTLSARCFSKCISLTTVCIPSSVKIVGADAFEKCTSLNLVYYTGTEDEYALLDMSTGNDYLIYANIKFNHNHLTESLISIHPGTCTQGGYSIYSCPCGYTGRGNYKPPTGHNLKFVETLNEPTCTELGLDMYECTLCGYSESYEVSAKGHASVTDEKADPTCTTEGKTKGSHCSRCAVTIVGQKPIPALGHDYTSKLKDSKHLASKATYKKAAKYYYSCSRCKKISSSKTFSGDKLTLAKVKKLVFTSDTKSVTLKWKSVSAARGYAVYKKNSKGKWTLIKRVTTNSFKIEKLTYGTTYSYAVRAYVKEGNSLIYAPEYKSIKVATKPLPTSKISAKQNEKAISLSWNKSKGATGYRVYKYDSKKEKWVIACSYTKSNKFTVKNLDSGRKYKFVVKSCIDTGNERVWSKSSDSFVTCTRPAKISVKSTPLKYSVKLEWSKAKYSDGYVVYMSEDANSGYKKVASTKKTAAEIKNLSSGKIYYFKVYSYRKLSDKNIYSYASEIKKVKTR